MSWFSDIIDAVVDTAEDVGGAVVSAVTDAVNWTGDLFGGDLGTQAMSVPEFVEQVRGGNSQQWHEGVQRAKELSDAHSTASQHMGRLLSDLEASWTGKASDAAHTRVKKLADVVTSASTSFAMNSKSLEAVAGGFDHAKLTLKEMPPPPDKSFGDILTPWDTDTEAAINRYNQRANDNLAIYDSYSRQAQAAVTTLQRDYGQLGFYDGGDVTLAAGRGRPEQHGSSGAHHRAAPDHTPAAGPGSVSAASRPAGYALDGHRPSPAPVAQPYPADHTVTAAASPVVVHPSSLPGDGVPNPAGGGSAAQPWSGGDGDVPPRGSARFAHTQTPAEREETSQKPTGAGAGIPKAGRQSGATFAPSGPHTGSSSPGPRAGGRVSAAAGGVAPGGRAPGGDDGEHLRKVGLTDATAITGDLEKTIDPTTGLTITPPTIGA
ncbi:PPE family protein [Amycolatopsis xylanica]|uniref:PPE family protein n=1 Tax=Amycolatopsis xylanica TaxID=589385 RepID=A0A1H2SGG3_9PSEU|nr:PPE domain-containing protein [Amycolatopsis xylanica]SDW30109.1 PPE family protein [Amycolatopsis xylanica]